MYWTGDTDRDGYGRVTIAGSRVSLVRVVYGLTKGALAAGMVVCHTCDHPRCIDPEHLFAGTPRDNTADSMAKGRHSSLHQAGRKRGYYHSPTRAAIASGRPAGAT